MSTKTLGVAVWDLGFYYVNFELFSLQFESGGIILLPNKKDFYDQILALNFRPKYAL